MTAAAMLRLKPATTGFTYGRNIWDMGKNGVILIDSNTMSPLTTPCVQQLPEAARNRVAEAYLFTPAMQVERKTDETGKLITNRNMYDAVKNQGELLIEQKVHEYGDPDLMGKIKPLPGFNNAFILHTSYHMNATGSWSPAALESALREYCMYAHMTGIQHLPVYMSMIGMQYNRGLESVPDPRYPQHPDHMVNVPFDKWNIDLLQSPAAALPFPGMTDGVNSSIRTTHHIEDVMKITKAVAEVLPLGGHIQVVV